MSYPPPHRTPIIERISLWWRNLKAMPVTRAFYRLRKGMKDHADYAHSWQCNIAMNIYDHCHGKLDIHECNAIADVIMQRFFDVKMNEVRSAMEADYAAVKTNP